jgi:hypothetical protein
MNPRRHLLLETIQRIAASGVSQAIGLPGEPALLFQVKSRFEGLFLIGPSLGNCDCLAKMYENLSISKIDHGGDEMLRIGTADPSYFEPILPLLCEIADVTQLDGVPFATAIKETLEQWSSMLAKSKVLTPEAERGLLGELWALDRLVSIAGPMGLDSWQGPSGELHDFALGNRLLEVKTTLNRSRIHRISDLRQLSPSAGAQLYLLSLQIRQDGDPASTTLPQAIDTISTRLQCDPERAGRFRNLLASTGYDEGLRELYTTRYRLRTKPALIAVADGVPAITTPALEAMMGAESVARILDLQYSINLDGLGHEDGSGSFSELLPWHESGVLR